MAGKESIEIGHLNEDTIFKSEVVVPSELTGTVSFSKIKTKLQDMDNQSQTILLNQVFPLATIYGQSFLLRLQIYDDDLYYGSIKITLQGAKEIVKIHELKIKLYSNGADDINYDMQEKIKNEMEQRDEYV